VALRQKQIDVISQETLDTLEFDRVRQYAAGSAASALGKARLSELVPFESASEAERAMALTGEMIAIISGGEFPIHGLHDIRAELQSASVEGAALEPDELLRVAETSHTGDQVRAFLHSKRQTSPLLSEMARGIADFKKLTAAIENAIAPEGEIKDEASPQLKKIRQSVRSETKALENKLQSVLQRWGDKGVLQDSVVNYREGKLVLPVKEELRNRVQGMIVDQSASGATVFMEPVETLEHSNTLRRLEMDERREIHRILLDLTAQVHERLEELFPAIEVLGELDEYYGRARLALRWEMVAPELNEKNIIRILRGRHPLLLERLKTNVVPLTMELIPPLCTVVISGPNAGGKTVVLKTVGVFCVMAAAGLFVPASPGTELPFFAGIHADIGDAQSIESDLSTFTAHISRLRRLVEDTSHPKLVLIDEIGSSTDPALGAALAEAVLLELTRQQAVSLVTTHSGTLKAFAHETDGMENGSMAFDEHSLQPTYAYRPGVPGSSYALEIAERVGFPKALLETARSFIGKGMLGLEELVSDLSQKIEQYEKLRRESDIRLTEYGALQKLYQDKTKELKRVQAETKAKAAAEAELILEKASRDMEAAIKQIKKEQASKEAVKAARETLREVRETVDKAQAESQKVLEPEKVARPPLERVNVGDRVEIADLQGIGTVLSTQRGGRRAEIEIGGVRLWVEVERLFAAPAEEKRQTRVNLQFTLETTHVSPQIDLRGKYGDEALPELDSYLAAAAESNLGQVTIIHGKGTGALRVKVREFLNTHPLVKSYQDGGPKGDDFGSTVVALK
jgi:DNA mismatch repair protein MutS2